MTDDKDAEISRLTAALAEAEARSSALVVGARAEKAEADELPWRMLRLAAETFCARVENGEIRSKRSYAAFKDALNAMPRQDVNLPPRMPEAAEIARLTAELEKEQINRASWEHAAKHLEAERNALTAALAQKEAGE